MGLSDLEPRFVCKACGKRGADIRPDFNWDRTAVGGMGYRSNQGRSRDVTDDIARAAEYCSGSELGASGVRA
jgi:hypothetical protein